MPTRKAGAIRAYGGVGRYLQGPGAIRELPEIVQKNGKVAVMVIDPFFFDTIVPELNKMFQNCEADIHFFRFPGECSQNNIDWLKQKIDALPSSVDVMIGFGGGKTMDLVRVASIGTGAVLVMMPTVTATNAATSIVGMVYDEKHAAHAVFIDHDPEYVIADTEFIIQAPARMLAAGIADALSTYYEARACWSVNNVNSVMPGYRRTICAEVIAKACHETLLKNARQAYQAALSHCRTEAFEDVVESINLLSGLGWENNGASLAHGIATAFPLIPEAQKFLHGEHVGFSILTQMIMDHDPQEEFDIIYQLCKDLNLPVCFDDFGIKKDVNRIARYISEQAFVLDDGMKIANYHIDSDVVYQAMLYLDSLSKNDLRKR